MKDGTGNDGTSKDNVTDTVTGDPAEEEEENTGNGDNTDKLYKDSHVGTAQACNSHWRRTEASQ